MSQMKVYIRTERFRGGWTSVVDVKERNDQRARDNRVISTDLRMK